MKKTTATLVAAFLTAAPGGIIPASTAPVCLAPASRVEAAAPAAPLFLDVAEPQIHDEELASLEAGGGVRKTPLDMTAGEEKARRLLRRLEKDPEKDIHFVYLDFNNLRLRNWVYTGEIMDVLIADFDHALATVAEGMSGAVDGEEFAGFCYKKGGDERVLVLPAGRPERVQRALAELKAYVRRRLRDKYKVGVLQLDDDSRIVTKGKEHQKDDRTRRFLLRGIHARGEAPAATDKGIIAQLETAPGVRKIVHHAEQYYFIYEDEEKVEKTFFELQRRYPRNNVDFKPHLYAGGLMDAFTVTAAATGLKNTLADLNGAAPAAQPRNPDFLLQQMALRAEIAAQMLNDRGKDRWAILSPEAKLLTQKREQARERVEVFHDAASMRRLSQMPGDWEKGQEDPRFRRLPNKKTAVETRLSAVKNPGFLIRLDIGYMNEALKRAVRQFEESAAKEIVKSDPGVREEDLLRELDEAWFNAFRMNSPRMLGVNTKFLNEIYHHGGTDDIISAILVSMWEAVRQLNSENFDKDNVWDGNIHFFRGPPDSLYFWFPYNPAAGHGEAKLVTHLKSQMEKLMGVLRELMRETTADPIGLHFMVSVQSVKGDSIPYGNVKKAWELLENMDRVYRVFLESVIKEDPRTFDQVWDRLGGVDEGTPEEILGKIREAVETVYRGKMREIDPDYSEARYDALSEDRFFNNGAYFLFYNGNIETRSERVRVDLAVNSQVEISRRYLSEKGQKWSAEIEQARRTGRVNADELLYVLSAMLSREGELFRFEEAADDLDLMRRDAATLFNAIRERRDRVNEMVYWLTGLYFDAAKGVIVPEKGAQIRIKYAHELFGREHSFYHTADGELKVLDVLCDPEKAEIWKKYRREQRRWLRFVRLEALFIKLMWAYEETLRTHFLAGDLAESLLETPELRPIFEELDAVLRGIKKSPLNSLSAQRFLQLQAWWNKKFGVKNPPVPEISCLCAADALFSAAI